MKAGNEVNSMQMYKMFGTTSHRDIMFRLRKAGYAIESEMVRYKNRKGVMKCYCRYWVASEPLKNCAKKVKETVNNSL